jgi:seryl-tRNA synthetase
VNYKVNNGIYNLGFELSKMEKNILDSYCNFLESKGYKYLSIPSTIKKDTFFRQEAMPPEKTLIIDDRTHKHEHYLSGSSETGILEYFADSSVDPVLIYAKNSCFRYEYEYSDLRRVKEFIKVEQFCFCTKDTWEEKFDQLMENATSFLEKLGIEYRIVDMTEKDEGYHIKKYDIEVKTEAFGWVETHSCTYFGEEQTKRFNITGATHTISNTGVASPRVLIPLMEKAGIDVRQNSTQKNT